MVNIVNSSWFYLIIFVIAFLYLLIIFNKRKKYKKRIRLRHMIVFFILLIGGALFKMSFQKNDDVDNVNGNIDIIDKDDSKNPNYIGTTSKGYIIEKIDGAYYFDGYLLVNKSYPLDSSWVPKNTRIPVPEDFCKLCIDSEAYDKWLELQSDAEAIGLNVYIASGYRSYTYQKDLYQKYVDTDGVAAADTYSARPGHSEHQTALAFDLNSVDSSFAATDEGKWISNNAYLYGFIIRYPKDKTNETGYKYEPWHLRYVGLDLAKKLYNNGNWISMESYFGIDSKYS